MLGKLFTGVVYFAVTAHAACTYGIVGPTHVPGLTQYNYTIAGVFSGAGPTNVKWSVDQATASIVGPANGLTVTVAFANTKADYITLTAKFSLGGDLCASGTISLVKVDTGTATFGKPGKPQAAAGLGNKVFLVNPPAPPAVPTWIVTFTPGSNVAAFTYNGTQQAAEPRQRVDSNGAGGGAAFSSDTTITLTSPAQDPTAQQQIQIGYLQQLASTGSAAYMKKTRTVTVPTQVTLDWYGPSAGDEWPWYDSSARTTGTGMGTFSSKLSMTDSPAESIPSQHNPNAGDVTALTTCAAADSFALRVGVRTLDTGMGADQHYFIEGESDWKANYAWPVVAGVSIITTGANWKAPATPTEAPVNVVPAAINGNAPFLRWTN